MKSIIAITMALAISTAAWADYALVEPSGRIAQIESKPFPVAAPMLWVAIPDGIAPKPGWTYKDSFKAPPEPPLPPSEAEKFTASVAADPKFRALVRALAEDKGKTEQQIIDWLKSKL